MRKAFMFCGNCSKKIYLEMTEEGQILSKIYECERCHALNLPNLLPLIQSPTGQYRRMK